jgi:hypothetical protein
VDEQEFMALASSDEEDATPALMPDPAANKWTLPPKDFWQPQRFSSFHGKTPTTSHQLSQKEVVTKYADSPQHKASGRMKVLQRAAEFKKATKEQHTKGTNS